MEWPFPYDIGRIMIVVYPSTGSTLSPGWRGAHARFCVPPMCGSSSILRQQMTSILPSAGHCSTYQSRKRASSRRASSNSAMRRAGFQDGRERIAKVRLSASRPNSSEEHHRRAGELLATLQHTQAPPRCARVALQKQALSGQCSDLLGTPRGHSRHLVWRD